jgi:hypothetical protein
VKAPAVPPDGIPSADAVREGVLATTVYFATNRIVTNPSDPDGGYTSTIVPPLKPEEITYGTAIIDGIDIATNAQGFVSEIKDTKQGGFSAEAVASLSNPGTDLLVFIHGFDNTFSDACGVQPRMACCLRSAWNEHD